MAIQRDAQFVDQQHALIAALLIRTPDRLPYWVRLTQSLDLIMPLATLSGVLDPLVFGIGHHLIVRGALYV